MIQTLNLPLANFEEIARELVETGKQVKVLWQEEESLAFVAKGRDYRSEFHINPSSELMYQISGAMDLYIRTPEGEEDRFQWFCPKCDNLLHEEQFVVEDYRLDPVSQAYRNFYTSEDARTCKRCGEVMPKPEGW